MRLQRYLFFCYCKTEWGVFYLFFVGKDGFVVFKPVSELLYAFFEGGLGDITIVGKEFGGVSPSAVNISGLHSCIFLDGFAPEVLLQQGDKAHERHGGAVPDVVNDGGSAGIVFACALGVVDDLLDAVDDVVDVSEVAGKFAVVEYFYRLPVSNGIGKKEGCHVGASPRSIDGKEAQSDGLDAVEVGVGVCHEFVALFGGSVKADRMVNGRILAERHFLGVAIDGG